MKTLTGLVAFLAFALVFIPVVGNAQINNRRPYDSTANYSETRISIGYASDYYFMGRADSAKAPYLSPAIGYFHRSGIFFRASFSYLTVPEESRVDLISVVAGYEYVNQNFVAGLSLSEYFYSDYSFAIASEMSTYLNVYSGYDFDVLMLYVDASLGFSEYTDFFVGAEINRTFYFFRNTIRVIPAVYMNAGSQYYYSEYYANRSMQTGSGKGKGSGGQRPPSTPGNPDVIESAKFQLQDFETDIQVVYKVGKFRFYTSATWTFPVNPATIVTDTGTYDEELKNGFYWSSGVRVTF